MRPLALLLVALLLSTSSIAQTSWREMPEGLVVSLDTRAPVGNFTFDGTSSGTAASTLLSVQVPLRGVWTLHGELPIAFSRHVPDVGASEYALEGAALAVGAPYLGAEVELAEALVLEAGFRWPAPDLGLTSYVDERLPESDRRDGYQFPEGIWGGILTEPHRYEVYQTYYSGALVAAIRAEPELTDRIRARLRLAPAMVDGNSPEVAVLVGYSVQAIADLEVADLSVGLIGQRVATGRVLGLIGGEPSPAPSLLVQVGRSVGSVRPGLTASVPLREQPWLAPDAVVGFSLDVPLR